ncbi:MAG TPA: type II toxin-antitoxin system VapB family antitoxin [Geminicoccaceae bacterium]|nr:type II toxin-antitoxin system VapB family antitoxin [Geminicoccaceae bacterium]
MALNIKSAKADRLARTLAARTGETITQAVERALEERLMREEGRRASPSLEEEILEIARRCASLPDLDTRSADEILGYDENGLPR